eukprot:TRINITY_DN14384_c0_g1_i1.p3 TRINITY_DN14384_c0_g1~~TRINITY_DN14384_c0_g1_i1.p3  ORF type:complete len:117 (-),score=39.51 TRINITY_DN14384_c0_g1_i1:173-502(-)
MLSLQRGIAWSMLRLLGALTPAPKGIAFDAGILVEVSAVSALAVAPQVMNEGFILQQGERVVAWLSQTVGGTAVTAAWAEVRRLVVAQGGQLWAVLSKHPYTATFGWRW